MDQAALHKEIDLIQEIIKRMANNSFLIKGWYITVMSALLLISQSVLKERYDVSYWVMLITPILFWYLDAYYLAQESNFRKLYNWVLQVRPAGNYTTPYDLNASKRFGRGFWSVLGAMFSGTLIAFYIVPILVLLHLISNAK